MGGVDQRPAHAADQQGDGGPLRARLDLQDGGRAGRRWKPSAITPADRITCPGYLDLGDTRFHCWSKGGHGTLDLHGGLKNSCDVYFYEVARRTGIDRIAAMAHRLGLGIELGIDLPGAAQRPRSRRGNGASRQGHALEHRRYHRQRYRPGLYPGDAAAARHLCRAGGHRPGRAAASDTQHWPAMLQPGRDPSGLAEPCGLADRDLHAGARTACGRW